MFNSNDTKLWVRRQCAQDHWERYYEALMGSLRGHPSKVVVIEIGAGVNVPSLRFQSERVLCTILDEHRQCPPPTLIRINPDYPTVEQTRLQPHLVAIRQRGLAALRAIDDAMEQLSLERLV
jgi:hypothetical protein